MCHNPGWNTMCRCGSWCMACTSCNSLLLVWISIYLGWVQLVSYLHWCFLFCFSWVIHWLMTSSDVCRFVWELPIFARCAIFIRIIWTSQWNHMSYKTCTWWIVCSGKKNTRKSRQWFTIPAKVTYCIIFNIAILMVWTRLCHQRICM